MCEGAACLSGGRCLGSQCFTSLAALNGTLVLRRGCVGEAESPLCGSAPTAELVVECCHGDLCNMNVSLQSPVKGEGKI